VLANPGRTVAGSVGPGAPPEAGAAADGHHAPPVAGGAGPAPARRALRAAASGGGPARPARRTPGARAGGRCRARDAAITRYDGRTRARWERLAHGALSKMSAYLDTAQGGDPRLLSAL